MSPKRPPRDPINTIPLARLQRPFPAVSAWDGGPSAAIQLALDRRHQAGIAARCCRVDASDPFRRETGEVILEGRRMAGVSWVDGSDYVLPSRTAVTTCRFMAKLLQLGDISRPKQPAVNRPSQMRSVIAPEFLPEVRCGCQLHPLRSFPDHGRIIPLQAFCVPQ